MVKLCVSDVVREETVQEKNIVENKNKGNVTREVTMIRMHNW